MIYCTQYSRLIIDSYCQFYCFSPEQWGLSLAALFASDRVQQLVGFFLLRLQVVPNLLVHTERPWFVLGLQPKVENARHCVSLTPALRISVRLGRFRITREGCRSIRRYRVLSSPVHSFEPERGPRLPGTCGATHPEGSGEQCIFARSLASGTEEVYATHWCRAAAESREASQRTLCTGIGGKGSARVPP